MALEGEDEGRVVFEVAAAVFHCLDLLFWVGVDSVRGEVLFFALEVGAEFRDEGLGDAADLQGEGLLLGTDCVGTDALEVIKK